MTNRLHSPRRVLVAALVAASAACAPATRARDPVNDDAADAVRGDAAADASRDTDRDAPDDAVADPPDGVADDPDALEDPATDTGASPETSADVAPVPDTDRPGDASDAGEAGAGDTDDVRADTATDVPDTGNPDVEWPPLPTCDDPPAVAGDAVALPLVWRDRASEAGLSGVQSELVASLPDSPCGEESVFTGGAAVADFDADGDLDVFLPRSLLPDQLYRNRGDGTFEDVAPALGLDSSASGNAAAWVDIDADGDLDLFVSNNAAEANHLWVRRDDGTWVDEAVARGVALDGEAERPSGCGHFTGATFADADGDLDLDLTLTRWFTRDRTWRVLLLLNDGTGVFRDGTVDAGLVVPSRSVVFGSSWFDFDGDGDRDALLTADFGTSRYFERRDGAFVEATLRAGLGTDENGMGAAVADFDADGDLDVFVTSIYGETVDECGFSWGCSGNRLYVNGGAGRFADCTDAAGVRDGGWGWGAAWFDADLDGDLDLAQASGYWPHWEDERLDRFRTASLRFRDGGVRLWRASAERPWVEAARDEGFVNDRRGRALIPFDADGDGDLDVLVVNNGAAPALLENTGAEHRHWLRVRLRGAAPNTFGIGAVVRVRVTPDRPWIRRDIATGDAYVGSSPPEAHFGLGDHAGPVDAVRVEWPAGGVTVLSSVDADRVIAIGE